MKRPFFIGHFGRSHYIHLMKNSKIHTLGQVVQDAERRFEDADLVFGHGVSNAFDDAAFLALETLRLPIDALEEFWEKALTNAEKQKLEDIIQRRIQTRKPSSYLVNRSYIQGLPFYVDERVLTPRSFIGEILCHEDGFSRIEDYEAIKSVVDISNGSGCLAILAAHLFPNAQIDASDLSKDALDVARHNVKDHELEKRVYLFEGDLFAPIKNRKYDLIITNPPYVDAEAMRDLPAEYRHEPAMALAGGQDGMDLVRKIIKDAPNHLTDNGGVMCEIGMGKDIIEAEYPHLPFLWLDTEESSGEVFWLTKDQFPV